jgi:hypothetical protein
MKKIGDHMKDLGFNEDASEGAKKAFIKYLMRQSEFHDRVTNFSKYQTQVELEKDKIVTTVGEQLSLFDQTGTE